MFREYIKRFSASLDREMELLWFGQFGRPVILFPTAAGRFFECEDLGLTASLADKVGAGEIQLVLPDTVNQESWYNKQVPAAARAARQAEYDDYLRHELTPYIHNRAQRGDLAVVGAEFGAYHAANFAGRHPEIVSRAVCFSGTFDIRELTEGHWDETCYFHCPVAYIANMDAEWVGKLSRVSWVLATGEYDPHVQRSRDFSTLLWSKGIPNELEIWEGQLGRDWPAWRHNLRRFL
jgi:esterase/lipase superfamily enzyme